MGGNSIFLYLPYLSRFFFSFVAGWKAAAYAADRGLLSHLLKRQPDCLFHTDDDTKKTILHIAAECSSNTEKLNVGRLRLLFQYGAEVHLNSLDQVYCFLRGQCSEQNVTV